MTPEPEWVDLGLPSGLLWAKQNLGAGKPTDAGLFYSWGNKEGHKRDSSYDFSQAVYDETPGAALVSDLPLSHDAARFLLGGYWRMPSSAEFKELVDNCTHQWVTINGTPGQLFTSNVNGNTIFFPAVGNYDGTTPHYQGTGGYYWATTYYSEINARNFSFDSANVYSQNYDARRYGFSVRAVRET